MSDITSGPECLLSFTFAPSQITSQEMIYPFCVIPYPFVIPRHFYRGFVSIMKSDLLNAANSEICITVVHVTVHVHVCNVEGISEVICVMSKE